MTTTSCPTRQALASTPRTTPPRTAPHWSHRDHAPAQRRAAAVPRARATSFTPMARDPLPDETLAPPSPHHES